MLFGHLSKMGDVVGVYTDLRPATGKKTRSHKLSRFPHETANLLHDGQISAGPGQDKEDKKG